MQRSLIIAIACLAALAGCGPSYTPGPSGMARELAAPDRQQQFTYSNFWSLLMPRDSIASRFERARTLCLRDKSLTCKILSANLVQGDGSAYSYTSAHLDLLLPRAKLAGYQKGLLAPVAGEDPGAVTIQSQSVRADSAESEASDAGRKVVRLTAYRDRLAALAKRPNLSVDDLIKLEAEQAKVEGDLDEAVGTKSAMDAGIARERLSVDFQEQASVAGPIAQVWRNSTTLFVDSLASVLRFLIQVVPWLPVIAAGIFLIARLWRLFRGRQKVIVGAEKTTGG